MTKPGIYAALVLPAVTICAVGSVVLFVSGHPVLASLLLPSTAVAVIVARFAWSWR